MLAAKSKSARRTKKPSRAFRRWFRKLASFEQLEDRRVLATVAWDGGGDGATWHDALNWDGDTLPGQFDDVVIDVPGTLTEIEVELNQVVSVQSLDVNERLFLRGPLEFNDASRIRQLRVQGADPAMVRGNGDLLVDELLDFRGGSIEGSGQLTIGQDALLQVLTPTSFGDKTTELFGVANIQNGVSGTGSVVVHPSATLNIVAAGSFLSSGFTGTQEVTNNGRIVQVGFGGGFAGFGSGARLVNNGEIDLQGAGLEILGGGATSTDLQIPTGSTLRFSNNTFVFGAGTRVFGNGTLELAGSLASYDFSDSLLVPTGTLNIVGGNITIANPLPPQLFVQQIRSANTFFESDQILDSTRIEFSQIGGAGKLTLTGNSLLQSTTFSNTGGITLAPGSSTGIGSFSLVSFNTLAENFGTINVGASRIRIDGQFTNREPGNLTLTDTAATNAQGISGSGILRNEGTLRKAGSSLSRVPFGFQIDNSGILQVEGGTLRFNDPDQTLGGRIEVQSGGVLQANLTLEDAEALLTGNGTIQGNVNNAGIVQPGNSLTDGGIGTLSVSGNYSQNATGQLEIDVAGLVAGSEHDQLQVAGSASIEGGLNILVDATFSPAGGSELSAITYASASGGFSSVNVVGSTADASVQLDANEAKVVFGTVADGLQPTFRGTAEPGSTVQLTSDISGSLGTTIADAGTGNWQLLVTQTLSNEIHTITASDPNDPDAEPQFNVLAELNDGDGTVDVAEEVSLRSGSIKFAPFGIDLDGVLEDDDIILDVENGALTFEVLESNPTGEVGQARRKFDGSIEFVGQNEVRLNGDFADSELLAGALPFTITRFTYRLAAEDGTIVNDLTAFGRFRNPDLKDEVTEAERTAIAALQALTSNGNTPTDEQVAEVLAAWLVQPDDPGDCRGQIECLLNAAARAENARKVFKPYVRLFEAVQTFGIDQGVPASGPVAGFMADFERIQTEIQINQIDGSADFLIREINDTGDYSQIKNLVAFIAEVELLGFDSGGFELEELGDDVFKQRIDQLIADGITQRNLRLFDEVFQVDADMALLLERTIAGYANDELTQRVLTPLIEAANASEDSSIAATAILLAASRGSSLTVDDFTFSVRQDASPFPRVEDAAAEDDQVFILVGDLPRQNGEIAIDDVAAFLESPPPESAIGRIQSGRDEFSFRVAFAGGELEALNLPTLNFGYKDSFGQRIETAAILSFDADFENGQTVVDVAGVMDFTSSSEDFDFESQVIFDAAGPDRGLTFNEDGSSRLSLRAQAQASLEPKSSAEIRDLLHFDIDDAQVGFELDVTFGPTGAQFETLAVTDAEIGSFEFALGGTNPAGTNIPDDALLVLTGQPATAGARSTAELCRRRPAPIGFWSTLRRHSGHLGGTGSHGTQLWLEQRLVYCCAAGNSL